MTRSWNLSLWIGFVFAILGFFGYLFFVQFPITRDFPSGRIFCCSLSAQFFWVLD